MALTAGACLALRDGHPVASPVLQLVSLTPEVSGECIIQLSDGLYHMKACLASDLTRRLKNALPLGCLCQLTEVRRLRHPEYMLYVQGMAVVDDNQKSLIGHPEDILSAPPPPPPASIQGLNTNPGPTRAQPQSTSHSVAQWPHPHSSTASSSESQLLSSLSPFLKPNGLRVRVTKKSSVKTYSGPKGDGKLFSIDLMDAQRGVMRATLFSEAVDKFIDVLQESGVYEISGGAVKAANRSYNHLNSDYELTLDDATFIWAVADDGSIPNVEIAFKSVRELPRIPKDSIVDIIGVVTEIGDIEEIKTKRGDMITKREVMLADTSGSCVSLTVWKQQAEHFNGRPGTIVLLRGVKTSDFGGVTLSATTSTSMSFDPQTPEAANLRHWWATRQNHQLTCLSKKNNVSGEFKTVEQIEKEGLGQQGENKSSLFIMRATLTLVRSENMWYTACKVCHKKVMESGSSWQCSKCQTPAAEMERRYVTTLTFSDHTGSRSVTAFDDVVKELLDLSADELVTRQAQRSTYLEELLYTVTFKTFLVTCRASTEPGRGLRLVATSIKPLIYAADCKLLLAMLSAVN